MNRAAIVVLRVLLVVMGLGSLSGQIVVIPLVSGSLAQQYPEVADLAVPYAVAAIAVVVCVQLALVAIWFLLAMVARSSIFARQAARWVTVIIIAGIVATVIVVVVGVHLLGVAQVGGPGAVLAVVAACVGGAAFVLLMVVMRGLLGTATALKSELDEVV
ncbi:MAG: DUF2975 domain-containing protein [Microbacterium sp.]